MTCGNVMIVNAKDGSVLLNTKQLYRLVFGSWCGNDFFLAAYQEFQTPRNSTNSLRIDLLSLCHLNNRPLPSQISVSVHDYSSVPIHVCIAELHVVPNGFSELEHALIAKHSLRPGHWTFICQVTRDMKKHLASVLIPVDCSGEPQSGNPSGAFDRLVALNGHIAGTALTPDHRQLLTFGCPGSHSCIGQPERVELQVYDVGTMLLLYRLPSRQIARPRCFYYCRPAASDTLFVW